jgi:hypothetical protein
MSRRPVILAFVFELLIKILPQYSFEPEYSHASLAARRHESVDFLSCGKHTPKHTFVPMERFHIWLDSRSRKRGNYAKEEIMNSERRMAIVTGALFILATASSLVGNSIMGSSLDAPNFLAVVSANQSRLILSVIFKFTAAAASAGIAISLYPVLRKQNEGLALGSVCFRTIEGVFYLVAALGLLSLVPLSEEYVKAAPALAPQLQIIGAMMLAAGEWAGFALGVAAFCLGASMYYYALFRAKLVPRWLSAWGLGALAMLLTMVVLGMFGGKPKPSGAMLILAFPIFVQEMVLALWLIAKGFDPKANKS